MSTKTGELGLGFLLGGMVGLIVGGVVMSAIVEPAYRCDGVCNYQGHFGRSTVHSDGTCACSDFYEFSVEMLPPVQP